MSKKLSSAFTIIELIVVIAIIAILAVATFVALDPAARLAQARNAQRWQGVDSLLESIKLYQSDNGTLPPNIDSTLRMLGTSSTECDIYCGGTETPATLIDDSQSDFNTGTYLDTQWNTAHVQLNTSGMNNGTGTYLSQVFDSARDETNWNSISWQEDTTPSGEFRMEVGSTSTDHTFTTVNLNQSYLNPIVFAFYYESSNSEPVSVRLNNIQSNSFDIALQSPSGATLSTDTIHYLVIEEGTHTMPDGTKIEAHTLDSTTIGYKNNWAATAQSYSHSYSGNPLILHQIQTYNDSGWIETWISRQNSRTNPPNTAGFQIAMNGAEAVTTHGEETLGWLAIETGTGSIDNINYEVQITTDSILGHQNGCYNRSFNNTYSSNPVVFGEQLEMDGNDGSWAVGCSLSTTQIGMHAEEDQETDSERGHTNETFGFLAFEQEFSYNSLEVTLQVRSCDDELCAGEIFVGPDGTGSTQFSAPSGEGIITGENRYFQYRTTLTTADSSFSPKLTDVTIGYTGITGGETTNPACLDLSGSLDYYLTNLPLDPNYGSPEKTYYAVKQTDATGSVQVISCKTELDESIATLR